MLIDDIAKLSPSSRKGISAALIVIAAIAMYNWIVAPQATYLFAAKQYERIVGRIANKNEVIRSTVEAKEKRLQELREQFAQLQGALFTPDQVKEFFSDLQAICGEVGCTVSGLSFITTESGRKDEMTEDASGIVPNKALLSVIGVYEDIIKLMKRLQMRSNKVWIDSINMESFYSDSPQVKCDITITVYTTKDREAALWKNQDMQK